MIVDKLLICHLMFVSFIWFSAIGWYQRARKWNKVFKSISSLPWRLGLLREITMLLCSGK